jgi:hypothetical protein
VKCAACPVSGPMVSVPKPSATGFAHQEAHAVTKYKLRERGVTAATWDRDNVGYKIARDGRR